MLCGCDVWEKELDRWWRVVDFFSPGHVVGRGSGRVNNAPAQRAADCTGRAHHGRRMIQGESRPSNYRIIIRVVYTRELDCVPFY